MISGVFWTLLKYITYTKGDKDLLNIWKCFIIEQNHRREGRGKTEMKRLHNNHQKIIARDLAQVWRWDSVLHLTPGITDGDHPIKIRSNLLNEGGWRTAACLHSISCNNYTPSGDWMSLVTFVLWFIHSKLAPINPGWSPTSRGNLKKKTFIGFFPLWNIPTFPQIPSENMLKGMLPGGNWLFSLQATAGRLDKTTLQSSSHYCLK